MVLSLFRELWREDFQRLFRTLSNSAWLIRALLFNVLIVCAVCWPLFY